MKETLKKTTAVVSEEFATLLTNAFALMAALAWSDFVKALFSKDGPFHTVSVGGPLIFACAATCIAVIVTSILGRFKKEDCTRLCKDAVK